MSRHFITFGAGDNNYYEAINILNNQAKEIQLFDEITCYTDEYLKKSEFWLHHCEFVNSNKRGYGYWLWKPYIIKKTMERMKDGDILLYLDSGCEINKHKKDQLINFFEYVKNDYIIGTTTSIEKNYNKMDLNIKLGMVNDRQMNTEQRQAGALMFLVCDKTRDIVNQWYNLGCDYHNIDDSRSIVDNLPTFIEHRHDQSIFSLLTKKYNIFSARSLYNCIEYCRNRTGQSRIR